MLASQNVKANLSKQRPHPDNHIPENLITYITAFLELSFIPTLLRICIVCLLFKSCAYYCIGLDLNNTSMPLLAIGRAVFP